MSQRSTVKERSLAEICCLGFSCLQLYWARVLIRKWLNISAEESDYSADTEDEDYSHTDTESREFGPWGRESRSQVTEVDRNEHLPRLRRRNSETFRAQYIKTKEIRICVGTWNVGGKVPPDDLGIDDWMDTSEPADVYVLGLQEIVPLNAVNVFGAEDNSAVLKWENIIRHSLNRVRPKVSKFKSYSDPPSPSKFKPSEDVPHIEEEISPECDSDTDEEIRPLIKESNNFDELNSDSAVDTKSCLPIQQYLERQISSPNKLDRLFSLQGDDHSRCEEKPASQDNGKLNRWLSGSERIGLSCPEPPLSLLNQHVLERPISVESINAFKLYKSFQRPLTSTMNHVSSDISLVAEIDLESFVRLRRRPSYVRIASKQMVGVFLTVWVRRSLRKHIRNLRVSTVGVGVMGYIGNKGSVSISMSIFQTLFCFVCTHLTSGEKEGDELKRNADVQEILRRTQFRSFSDTGLSRSIWDHERIIWLGDLNYRINFSYEKTLELIARKEWPKLVEKDQLSQEMRKGRVFDGWSEGTLNFPPTYKYEISSERYCGEDPESGKRTPAWCDRILAYGKGWRLLGYRRAELKLSDHRPVTATYMAEVEVFSPRFH